MTRPVDERGATNKHVTGIETDTHSRLVVHLRDDIAEIFKCRSNHGVPSGHRLEYCRDGRRLSMGAIQGGRDARDAILARVAKCGARTDNWSMKALYPRRQ